MAPPLLFIIGPPAVGKMAVGHEIAERTGMRLFHNHMAIDPVLRLFPFGTPPFQRLVDGFRTAVFEEVAASDLPGLIFTFVWAFDHEEDHETVLRYAAPFTARGSQVSYVELQATQEERLRRNRGDFRLAEKPTKRDFAASRQNLLEMDAGYRLNTTGEFDSRADYLRLDNTAVPAAEAAAQIISHFGLEDGVHQCSHSEPPSKHET
jgi:hypothetical protein